MTAKITLDRLPEGVKVTVEGNGTKSSQVLSDFEIKSLISILTSALNTKEFSFTFPLEF